LESENIIGKRIIGVDYWNLKTSPEQRLLESENIIGKRIIGVG